ncbi:tubulin-like doman-containing protein [Ancylobacter mangrovi]|uniref:tubulin-like doman-containing protein n=1 Tax=Ancylobacter mangrovi TaxID=2972472 RepID=UPI0021614510|nr:tubulin-like doman-containing protein [Ancylobacter mangrovi]MCS0502195.1 GYF domain-containing protein [Ancylobacter mangrovi]
MAEANGAFAQADRSETLRDVMPTVFIALGGTGMEILLRLRRRILQHNWSGRSVMSLDEFPPARFIYFDTDTGEARESGRAATSDLLASRVAFSKGEAIQKKVDTAHYMAEIDNYPIIKEWLPRGDLDKFDTEKGAGQVRSISRLLFYHEYSHFMDLVRSQADRVMQNVTNDVLLQGLGLKTTPQLRIVVVASSAGGTGSGAFIDVGYALRSMRSPSPDQVDLFLMLPGGYKDANKDRVFANTYAALSELEFAMLGSRNPPYVQRWTDLERPGAEVRTPYSDVYLFDRENIAGQQTGNKEDVFDMVADILFEDFGSSDFARRKRSVGVNQQQHKLGRYFPSLPEWLKDGLSYSRAYSAIGQTMVMSNASVQVEEHLARNNAAMVRAFFGMALDSAQKTATTEQRDQFLQDWMRITPKAFVDDYDERARFAQQPITDFALVDYILLREDKSAITGMVSAEVEQDFAGLLGRVPDHRAWEGEVRRIVAMRQRDVDGRVGTGTAYGPKGAEVAHARERFETALLSRNLEEGGLYAELYRLLDDQERGGLEYTIDLVAKLHARLDDAGGGIIARLRAAEEAYAQRASWLNAEQLQASIDRLQQAAQSSFLTGGGRKASEKYLNQVRDDLIAMLQARLRAIACREAVVLLEHVAQFLGVPQDMDERGETSWSGLIGEFQAGRKRVRSLLAVLDADTLRLQDALARGDGGTFFVIRDKGVELPPEDGEAQLAWAREAFESIGGSREIFARLDSDEGRLEILGLLRSVSNKRLGQYRERIPSVIDALRQLPLARQQRLMELLVVRALPWIHTDFSRGYRPGNENFKLLIAVDGARSFRAEFDEMLRSRLPTQAGITSINYEESGVPGRIVCYCELSGIPLDAIASLKSEWQLSYLKEQGKPDSQPLHNHVDYLRFPDPVVPDKAALEDLVSRTKLFIEGVMLGVLRFDPARQIYELEVARGDWSRIGSEKYLRRRGFMANQQTQLQEQVKRRLGRLGAIEFLALAALAQWYAKRVYTELRIEVDQKGATRNRGGIGFHTCIALAEQYLNQSRQTGGALPGDLAAGAALENLLDAVPDWTTAIAGTLDDVDDPEVSRDPEAPSHRRATDKRTVNWSRFDEATLARIASGAGAADHAGPNGVAVALPGAGVSPGISPPAPPAQRYWLFNAEGQVAGPYDASAFRMLAELGQLSAELKVCPEGTQAWVTVGEVPALKGLLAPAAPVPPPPPPLS